MFISEAYAQAAAVPADGGALASFLPIILIFGIFYFLVLRPQSKRHKEHKQTLSELSRGDRIVTNGGLIGKITKLEDAILHIEVSKDVVVQVSRSMVASVIESKAQKAADAKKKSAKTAQVVAKKKIANDN